MKSVWFVTPAFRRLEISEVVFEQRARACDVLAGLGVAASCVVIADDANLELARAHGFGWVERDNGRLGIKFNDGYELAAREGIDFVIPAGSDSWICPEFVAAAVKRASRSRVAASRNYAVVHESGARRLQTLVDLEMGATMCVPVSALAGPRFRPLPEHLKRGCDTALVRVLRAAGVSFARAEVHALETVAFQTAGQQITSYDRLAERWGVGEETDDAFAGLEDVYPAGSVESVRSVYAARQARAAA